MNDLESETKYEPFSNKRMFGFRLGVLMLSMINAIYENFKI